MDVHSEINYPDSSPDDVFVMLCDADYRTEVCKATHALGYDVDIDEHDDGGATVTVTRTMPAEVPDFVKKFVGDTIELRQIEEWGPPDTSGARTADVTLDIVGQPATMTGSIFLEAVGSGSRQRVEAAMKVSIPFLGKTMEPEVVKGILAGLRQEERTGNAWLAKS
jgi:hypothetical protein